MGDSSGSGSRPGSTQAIGSPAPGPSSDRAIDFQEGDEIGDYRVDRKLGEGGMGTVYAGVHTVIGKRAAIKLLRKELCANPEAIGRFIQEARAVNQIGHPNIVDVFGFGTSPDGRAFLAMEWLKGESLGTRIDRSRLEVDEACAIVDEIARALEAAHEAGIIHRDLKPDNVFLAEVRGGPSMVKLLDFGIAKLTRSGGESQISHTQTGAIIGTPVYIAPEQARGYAIDGAADIYALGVMTFQLLVGQTPFTADNAMDLISKHLSEQAPRMSTIDFSVPEVLDSLVARMLEKQPTLRPSLTEIRNVLEPLRRTPSQGPIRLTTPVAGVPILSTTALGPTTAPHPTPFPAPESLPNRSRKPILALASGVVLVGAIAFAVVSKLGGEPTQRQAEPEPTIAKVAPPPPGPDPVETPLPAPVVPTPPPVTVAAETNLVVTLEGAKHATLSIDGVAQSLRTTRTSVNLSPGSHVLEITSPGRIKWTQTVEAKADVPIEVTANLRRAPAAGTSTMPIDEDGLADPFKRKNQ